MQDNDGDFSVYPDASAVGLRVFELLSQFKRELRAKDIAARKEPGESDAAFLLRTAITAQEEAPALFRQNAQANPLLTSAWLSIVKNKARTAFLAGQLDAFDQLSDSNLREIAQWSAEVAEFPQVRARLAAQFGIILVVESAFAAMKTDGCVFTLPSGTPVIGMSLRYNRYDNFWFTLMHELAHISMHYKHLATPILDDLDGESESEIEIEANRIAMDALVPRNIWRKMLLHRASKEHLTTYARQAGVHPAVAAGLIRHRTQNYAMYADLVQSIDVARSLGVER